MKPLTATFKRILSLASVFALVFLLVFGALGVDAQNPQATRDTIIAFDGPIDIGLIESHGGEVTREFTRRNTVQATLPEAAIDALHNHPFVRYVEQNDKVEALDTVPWGVERVFDDESYPFSTWNTTMGENVKVGVIDTGIDENHPDLNVVGGVTTLDEGGHWGEDENTHGTHVAGTIAALQNDQGVVGVSPNVELYSIKALDDADGVGTTADIIDGIDWALENDLQILNMSLGLSSDSTAFREALDDAYAEGVLLIAAAGNEGSGEDTVMYPARYDSVIAVSASEQSGPFGNDDIANFSSTGDTVELIAPGANIESTMPGGGTDTKSGTSMAAPHVAGVAALVWSANADLTHEQVRGILRDTAEDIGLETYEQGYGMARADLAVTSALDAEGGHYITAQSGEGGIIEPSGNVFVEDGESQTFTFTADTGYEIDDVVVDGNSLGAIDEYTFEDVGQNHSISVSFAQIEYTISFETFEGESVDSMTAYYEEDIVAPDDPERTGYSFSGWYVNDDFEDEFVFDTMPAENLTLYAKWEVEQFTITFDSNEGSFVAAIHDDYGADIEEPDPPTRDGYVFEGWYEDENLNTPFVFDTMPPYDLTLYASWRGVDEVRITFETDGGSEVETLSADSGDAIEAPEDPEKEGHTFEGWYLDESYEEAFAFDTMPEEDFTLYAKWSVNVYTIAFDTLGGNDIEPITFEYGEEISLPDAEKEGEDFLGWYKDAGYTEAFDEETMPAEDVLLYARYGEDVDYRNLLWILVIVAPIAVILLKDEF